MRVSIQAIGYELKANYYLLSALQSIDNYLYILKDSICHKFAL